MKYMPRLKHVPSFDGAFTYDGVTWEMDDGIFVVDDATVAENMVDEFSKLSYASDERPTVEPEETTDYPTNEDGEPLCVGKDEGQCSRVVEEPNGTCWQHD